MYRIAICENEPSEAATLENMVYEVLDQVESAVSCTIYTNTAALQQALEGGEEIHLILLDILMPGKNGMEFAVEMREAGIRTGIIFITCSIDYVLQGYDVQAIKYILKPIDRKELKKAIFYDYYNHFLVQNFCVRQGSAVYTIRISDLMYVENKPKKSAVYLKEDMILVKEKLLNLEKVLRPYGIYRCHQSFLININNVTEVIRYEARLVDGRKVPVSKAFFKSIQNAFLASNCELIRRELHDL